MSVAESHPPAELEFGNEAIQVHVSPVGAELTGIRLGGRERLWNRDPRWWGSSAPLLFPVIGRCREGRISIGRSPFPMAMHGFIGQRTFAVVARSATRLTLRHVSDAETHAIYPYPHTVTVTTELRQDGIAMVSEISNAAGATMPYCFGYHPAFPWSNAADREDYVCRFAEPEGPTIRKTDGSTGLLRPLPIPSPLSGRTLHLRDDLFDRGLQFEDVRSRRVWFGKRGEPGVEVSFPDSHQLAIWTKPGAPLLSIEPWQGFPQEAHLDDALEKRHGVCFLKPGETARYRLGLSFDVADPGA